MVTIIEHNISKIAHSMCAHVYIEHEQRTGCVSSRFAADCCHFRFFRNDFQRMFFSLCVAFVFLSLCLNYWDFDCPNQRTSIRIGNSGIHQLLIWINSFKLITSEKSWHYYLINSLFICWLIEAHKRTPGSCGDNFDLHCEINGDDLMQNYAFDKLKLVAGFDKTNCRNWSAF